MSPSTATLIGITVTVVLQLLTAAFIYGKLTEAVQSMTKGLQEERSDRKDEIRRLDREQSDQWNDINSAGRAMEKIKGKLGMNGA